VQIYTYFDGVRFGLVDGAEYLLLDVPLIVP